ncbi:MAG: hypothetical protein WBD20_00825 [Pirellulaceae bacterium]
MSRPVVFEQLGDLVSRVCLVVCIAAMAICSSPSHADDPPAAGFSNAPANEVTKFKGTLKGFQRGVLQVAKEDGSEVMIQLPASADAFTFVADAKPPFLQRGMMVRFRGTFAANGTAQMPIEKVEIFQPINLQGIPGHSRERFMPGVHPVDKHAAKKPVGIGEYTVVGSLMGINANGAIMVQAGKIPVAAPLAQTATFQIRFNNLSLAQEGDVVNVAGFYNPPDETKIRGDVISVTTDRIYGEPTEAPPRRSRRTPKRTTKDAAEKSAEGEAEKAVDDNPEKASAEDKAE